MSVDELKELLAVRVEQLRTAGDLSQEELAVRCGLATVTVWRIEKGVYAASLETLAKLADGLGVPVVALLTRADEGDLAELEALLDGQPARVIALVVAMVRLLLEDRRETGDEDE